MIAPEISRLLVVGSVQTANKAVVTKLRELCNESTEDANKSDEMVLNLQTKYYRAPVEVHVHQVLDNEPEHPLQHELCDYEAVICVVDAGQRESFLHVHRFAKRIVDTLAYDVCLLVAGTSSATVESVKEMESWCQTSGFEFVALDGDKYALSDDNVIDEKQGVERVLEALHCNMWKSMKTSSSCVEAPASLEVTEDAEKQSNQEETGKSQASEKETSSSAEDSNTSMDDSRLQTLLQALEIVEPGEDTRDDDKDADIDMAQFSALISEVRTVRDQGQSLADEERRERAAEVAMKLWSFLGEDDDDASNSD